LIDDDAKTGLRFGLYLKVWVVLAMLIGAVVGVLSLINAYTGGSTTAGVFFSHFEGTTAGYINIVWIPVLFALGALIVSPLMYFPFRWALRITGAVMVDRGRGQD
jgi:hypothetical protein